MSRPLLAILIYASVTACGSVGGKTDERLDGVWVSDQRKTLANIGSANLSAERLRFLRENVGQLRYCFHREKIAAYVPGTSKEQIDLDTYWVTETTPSSATVNSSPSPTR